MSLGDNRIILEVKVNICNDIVLGDKRYGHPFKDILYA